jgi:O-antigen/teichoic acid export membrane protein
MRIFKGFGHSILKIEFTKNVLWSFTATTVLAISGLLINIIIINHFSISVLGNFNITLSLYIIFSQFSAGGIYYSTLHFSANPKLDYENRMKMLSNGLLIVFLWSIIASLIVFLSRNWLNSLFPQSNILPGIISFIPGLLFFSINKVLLSFINGINKIKTYSLFQSIRYFLIILFLVLFILFKIDSVFLITIFSAAEIVLFILILTTVFGLRLLRSLAYDKFWFMSQLLHGIKALTSGLIQDILTRTDIIILGLMLTSYYVGIYSFPALVAEGFLQIPMAFMIVVNPLISKHLASRNYKNIFELFINTGKSILAIMVTLSLLVIIGFPFLINFFVGQYDLMIGWKILIIMLISIIICSPFYAFQMILNQSGKPFYYSILMLIYLIFNISLNIILIGKFGVIGAAYAAAVANIMFILTFILFIRLTFGKFIKNSISIL